MNADLKAKCEGLRTKAIQDIETESGLNIDQKKQDISKLKTVEDQIVLDYLGNQYRDALNIHAWLQSIALKKSIKTLFTKKKK